jgi:hypothetical protein
VGIAVNVIYHIPRRDPEWNPPISDIDQEEREHAWCEEGIRWSWSGFHAPVWTRVWRAHSQSHSSPWSARTGTKEWCLCGCHVRRGRLKMHRARIGWRVASAVTGEIHDDSSEGKHTEGTGETRGFEPLAWIHQRSAKGGESRRCLLLAGNRGNLPGAARDRFVRARASTRVHEAIRRETLHGTGAWRRW